MADNYLWQMDWKDSRSGYGMRLEIIPRSADALSSLVPTLIEAGTIISGWKYEWEYDDIILGVPSVTAEFTLFLDRITDTNLLSYLSNPFLDISDASPGSGIPFTINAANIFKLYVQFNGNDSNDPAKYRLIYVGVQTNGIESGYDPEKREFEIKTIDIYKATLVNMDFLAFTEVLIEQNYILHDDNGYYETMFQMVSLPGDSIWASFNKNETLRTRTLGQIDDLIYSFFSDVISYLLRESITLTKPAGIYPSFYSQSGLNVSVIGGTPISESNIYIPVCQYPSYSGRGGGFFDLVEAYKTMWDYMSDHAKELLRYICYDYAQNEVVFNTPYSATSFNFDLIGNTVQLYPFNNIVKRVAAEFIESGDGDVERIEIHNKGSRNDNTINVPIIFQNSGTVGGYGTGDPVRLAIDATPGQNAYKLNQNVRIFLSEKFRYCVFLYRNNPTFNGSLIFQGSLTKYFLVSEYLVYNLGNGKDSDDFYYNPTESTRDVILTSTFFNQVQNRANGRVVAETLKGIYGSNKQNLIKINTGMYFDFSFTSNDNVIGQPHPYFFPGGKLAVNLSQIAPPNYTTFWGNLYDKYYIRKLSIENGNVELEALGLED